LRVPERRTPVYVGYAIHNDGNDQTSGLLSAVGWRIKLGEQNGEQLRRNHDTPETQKA
jgi:hypothetical protein